jgi:ubiquinone/menaquinone biosynthesis C-methylase UbiE
MLDLVRLSHRRLFPPGGQDLYRQVARLTDLAPGMELLDVASGKGILLEYFAREYGIHGTGVEEDPRLIAEAERYMRTAGLGDVVSFQAASPDDLPFRDETFDVVVGEVGLAGRVDPKDAIRELVRVTRPGGQVVLVQLVWKAPVDENRRGILSAHLGARPLMMVEVRRVLLEAGVVELVAEDWTDEQTAFRPQVKKPFPDFTELFTLREKLGILRRAWRRWGWRGVLTVLQREGEVHRLLTRERLLGLSLLKGTKAPGEAEAKESPAEPEHAPSEDETPGVEHPDGLGELAKEADERREADEDLETAGLPLFVDDTQE